MAKDKVLILVPAPTARGGISNYYQVLRDSFGENIEYFERGARTWPVKDSRIKESARIVFDYLRFLRRLKERDVALVQSTTSLSLATTYRDGLFLMLAKWHGAKTIVFFRGWDDHAEAKVSSKLALFFRFFGSTDAAIVLSTRVGDRLTSWGYKAPVYLETTLFDKELSLGVTPDSIKDKFLKLRETKLIRLLYLSRVERRKGIYDLLQALQMMMSNECKEIKFELIVCGDGLACGEVQQFAKSGDMRYVTFRGHVQGEEKKRAFMDSHLFVFPSYGEGMPNAVLEAMGMGLPVLTTPVGGVVDFFEDGEHGRIVPIGNVQAIHDRIIEMSNDIAFMEKVAQANYNYANNRFRSDIVGQRVENIFKEVMR